MTVAFENQIRLEIVDERLDETSGAREYGPMVENDAKDGSHRTILRLLHDGVALAVDVRFEHVDI